MTGFRGPESGFPYRLAAAGTYDAAMFEAVPNRVSRGVVMGRKLNPLDASRRAVQVAANGFDWIFRRQRLVKSGQTGFELIYQGDPMAVRHYSLAEEDAIELADGSRMPVERRQHPVPLVLVPPLGVISECFDLMPQRSLVRYMAARGFKTYLIDWGRPQKRHARFGLADYADRMFGEALQQVRRHSGSGQVSLMGWCMGGLLSLMHQGLERDPDIRNIVTVASPIDLRGAGVVGGLGQAIYAPAQLLRRHTDWRLHKVDPSRLSIPPRLLALGFKLTDPVRSVTTYWDLITRLWDREFVISHSTTSDYLNNMLRYPGGVVQDFTVRMAVDNQLAQGRLQVGDRVAELDRIECPLLVFAGQSDHLVPPPVARKSVDVVASADKDFRTAPGGHMGVILGGKAQKAVWAQSADWLAVRSQHAPHPVP
jgi:polyhydroxyalkanoate synthase subunit PhaC